MKIDSVICKNLGMIIGGTLLGLVGSLISMKGSSNQEAYMLEKKVNELIGSIEGGTNGAKSLPKPEGE